MNIKRLLPIALSLCFLFSCSKGGQDVLPQESEMPLSTTSVAVDLSAELAESDLRALDITLKADGPTPELGKKLTFSSVCIIKNASGNKTYYVNIPWHNEEGGRYLTTGLFLTKTIDNGALDITLPDPSNPSNPDNEWYMMGFLGGSYNHSTKRVSYNPNPDKLVGVALGETQSRDIPIGFGWTKLKILPNGPRSVLITTASGKSRPRPSDTPDSSKGIQFQILGSMLRLSLNNENINRGTTTEEKGYDAHNAYAVRIKHITFESNVLTTSNGYYDLRQAPAVTNSDIMAYTPASGERVYTFEGNAQGVDIASGKSHDKQFLIWASPLATSGSVDKPVTHLVAEAKRLDGGAEQALPAMSRLYIWGSRGKIKHGSRHAVKTYIVRPKLALEYTATSYYDLDLGETFPKGEGNVPLGLYSYERAKAIVPPQGWILPMVTDVNGAWMHTRITGFDTSFEKTGTPSNFDTKGGGRMATRINGIYSNSYTGLHTATSAGARTIYALLNRGDKNSSNAPTQTPASRVQYVVVRYKASTGQDIQIDAAYLGPNYVGDNLAPCSTSFFGQHATDLVQRSYRARAALRLDYYENKSKYTGLGVQTWSFPDASKYATFAERRIATFVVKEEQYANTGSNETHVSTDYYALTALVNSIVNDKNNPTKSKLADMYVPLILIQAPGTGWGASTTP